MIGARTPRRVLVALAVASTALVGVVAGGNPPRVAAASPHRAAVIVDTGTTVHRVVITFTEDSITGIDALQRAGANPVVYTFGGQGGAVCRLFGVGRDAGPNCLGGQDGDNRYWAYFRAPAGSSSFKYSTVGAGTARVHDGDVEGWKFGTGAAPEFVSLQSLLPPPPPPPTTPATHPASGRSGSGSGSGSAGGSSGNTGSTPSAVAGQQASGAPTSSSTLPATGPAAADPSRATAVTGGATGAGARSATKSDDGKSSKRPRTVETALASSEDRGGSSASLVWFAVLLAAIVVAIFVVRRVRRQSS